MMPTLDGMYIQVRDKVLEIRMTTFEILSRGLVTYVETEVWLYAV